MTRTTLSVVVPTRNRRDLLAQTLFTVLAQDVDGLEVIVVDDASRDGTADWLSSLRDPRVRTVRNRTAVGVSTARNLGIEVARGQWLGFVDDDDVWFPGKLRAQLEAAETQGASWVFTGALTFGEGPQIWALTPADPTAVEDLPWRNTVPGGGSNVLARRDALDAVGGFDADASIVADWDMWIRLLQHDTPAVVTTPLVGYRRHATNMSRDLKRMLAGVQAIDDRYVALRDGDPVDWELCYRWFGRHAQREGAQLAAMGLALRAVRAGHPGAVRRLIRTTVPWRPRPPVADPADADHWLDRFRRRQVIPWPDGAKAWLEQVACYRPETLARTVITNGMDASAAPRPTEA